MPVQFLSVMGGFQMEEEELEEEEREEEEPEEEKTGGAVCRRFVKLREIFCARLVKLNMKNNFSFEVKLFCWDQIDFCILILEFSDGFYRNLCEEVPPKLDLGVRVPF